MDLNCEFPSDRGKFPDIINNSNLIRQIIAFGPCKLDIKFPLDSTWCQDNEIKKCRKCSVEYYFTTNLAGHKIPISWLCYSVILDKENKVSCCIILYKESKESIKIILTLLIVSQYVKL